MALKVNSAVTEGGVGPVVVKLVDHTILDPPKRLIGIGHNIVEADANVEKPAIFTDTNAARSSTH